MGDAAYRAQGVTIHDKQIEVIIRHVMRWVMFAAGGDIPMIMEEKIDKHRYREINEQAIKGGGQPTACNPQLLGITKA